MNLMTDGSRTTRELLLVGSWLGVAYGLAEALEFCVLGLVPGALAWRNGNAPQVIWVAPAFYGVVGVAIAALVAVVSRAARRIDWTRALVFGLLAGGAYLGARLQGEVLSWTSSLLLAVGIGVQLTRRFTRRRDWWLASMRRTLVPLVVLVAIAAAGERAWSVMAERRALARVPVAEASSRPNVLLLVADTLRADHVGAYGYRRPTTPRIDRLAGEGRLFLDAYSDSSWTLPSHASLLTGTRVHEHRAGHERQPYLDRRFATLAEVFGQAGYASGGFIANTFWCGRQTRLDRGFARYEDFYGNAGDALARTVLGRMVSYEILPKFGFIDIPGRKHAADINDSLLRWVDGLGGRPWFVFANYMDVHGPYIPPPSHEGRFTGTRLDRGASEVELGAVTDETKVPEPRVLRAWQDRYDESLLYLDEEVGRLLDELDRRGVLENTIVVFTSDHGESWGEHDLIYHGHSLYQPQIRIPLVVRYPKRVAPGERDSRPIALDRIPRLLVDLAGIGNAPFAGRSPLAASGEPSDDVAVSEVSRRRGVPAAWPTASGWLRSIQTDRFQLIVSETGKLELFDLASDPGQTRNLAPDSASSDVVARLRQRLDTEVGIQKAARR